MIKEFDIDFHKKIIYISLNGCDPHSTIKYRTEKDMVDAILREVRLLNQLPPDIKPLGMTKLEWEKYEKFK